MKSLRQTINNILVVTGLLVASTTQAGRTFQETFDDGPGIFTNGGNSYIGNGVARLRGDSDNNPGAGFITVEGLDGSDLLALKVHFYGEVKGLDEGEYVEVSVDVGDAFPRVFTFTEDFSGRQSLDLGPGADFATVGITFRIVASSFFEVFTIEEVIFDGRILGSETNPAVSAEGYFLEGRGTATTPDTISITNTGSTYLRVLLINLEEGNASPVFDPEDVNFTVTSTDDVGFDNSFQFFSPDGLLILFNAFGEGPAFDPGETFSFTVDVDDGNGGYTRGVDFSGAQIQVESRSPGTLGTFVADPANINRANFIINSNP